MVGGLYAVEPLAVCRSLTPPCQVVTGKPRQGHGKTEFGLRRGVTRGAMPRMASPSLVSFGGRYVLPREQMEDCVSLSET